MVLVFVAVVVFISSSSSPSSPPSPLHPLFFHFHLPALPPISTPSFSILISLPCPSSLPSLPLSPSSSSLLFPLQPLTPSPSSSSPPSPLPFPSLSPSPVHPPLSTPFPTSPFPPLPSLPFPTSPPSPPSPYTSFAQQTYYGADGIDIDSVGDSTQQAAMRTMVRTYGQMPLQLFREPHLPRSKSPVLTTFRMRIGYALRRFTSTSSLSKVSGSEELPSPHRQKLPLLYLHISIHACGVNVNTSTQRFKWN